MSFDVCYIPILSEVKQGYPLNLSISLSGGKENNYDCLSTGEGSGKSPNCKSLPFRHKNCNLQILADRLTRPQVSWNAPPWKVKALYGTGQPISEIRRVGLLGIAALNGR